MKSFLKNAKKFDVYLLKNGMTGVFIQNWAQDIIQVRVEEEDFYLFVDKKDGKTCNRHYADYDIIKLKSQSL